MEFFTSLRGEEQEHKVNQELIPAMTILEDSGRKVVDLEGIATSPQGSRLEMCFRLTKDEALQLADRLIHHANRII
jgi:hypothetical protein